MSIANVSASPTAPKGYKVTTSGRSLTTLSNQWIARRADEKYLSISDLLAATKRRRDSAQEVRLNNQQITIITPDVLEGDSSTEVLAKMQRLTFGLPDGREVAPTHWAFNQIMGLAGVGRGSDYVRTLPSSIVSDALQYSIRYNRSAEDVKVYTDELEALAITGPDYGRIFNHEVAEAVAMVAESTSGDHRWKVPGMLDWRTMHYDPHHPVTLDTTTLFANDKGVFMFLCQDLAPIEIGKLPDGSPDLVFRGFYVTNSEVGAGAMKIGVMYLRAICCNRILWGVEGFEEITMRHSKYAPGRFIEEAAPALHAFAQGSTTKLIDGIAKARDAKVADTKDKALEWLAGRNIARKRALAIFDNIVREERQGDETDRPVSAWELAQGITAQARSEINFDTRMDLERDAKTLLDKVA